MPHRLCMRHLVYMRTQVRAGVADGDIDVTSTAAGKVWKNMSGLIKGWSRPTCSGRQRSEQPHQQRNAPVPRLALARLIGKHRSKQRVLKINCGSAALPGSPVCCADYKCGHSVVVDAAAGAMTWLSGTGHPAAVQTRAHGNRLAGEAARDYSRRNESTPDGIESRGVSGQRRNGSSSLSRPTPELEPPLWSCVYAVHLNAAPGVA
jgi:hypothetical protein